MLRIILILVPIIIAVFVIVTALQPAGFRITRSANISAPPAGVFALVNDFHKWEAWSPWGKIDPAMKQTYGGPPAGPGSVYFWAGNGKVGEGRMTLTDSRPHEHILIKLEFLKPFAATNATEFNFKPEGGQTKVTWTMTGERNVILKAMGLFMNMDKMIGGQFEQGLANLNTAAAAAAKK